MPANFGDPEGTWEDSGPAAIYIDASFLAPSDGSTDTNVELTLAEADGIGAYKYISSF